MTPIENAHRLRLEIDNCIKNVGLFKTDKREGYNLCTREASLAYTRLQEAKMWMGKCLEQLGSELPEEFRDKA